MKKSVRRVLCLGLCLLMVVGIFPLSAFADSWLPRLADVTISDTWVAVPDQVEVIVEATDQGSGVYGAILMFLDEETGVYILTEAYATYWDEYLGREVGYEDGNLHGLLDMTKYMPAGTYSLVWVYVVDNEGNATEYDKYYDGFAPDYMPLPEDLESVALVVSNSLDGWVQAEGQWFYYDDGHLIYSQWMEEDGKWYYLNDDGTMAKGWLKLKDKWYYFDKSGVMVTGTVTIEGEQHKFSSSGVWLGEIAKNGWVSEGGKWYYYKNGSKATGWLELDGKWYFMNEYGVMQTGWLKRGNTWYYLKSSGVMATGWVQVGNEWYFMNESGTMQTGWVKDNGKWYYMDASGAMHTGWLKLGNSWYYLNSSGAMVTGTQKIDGKTYRFNSSGVWIP